MERLDRLVGFYDRDGYSHFYFYDITGAFTADYGRKAVGMTLSSLPERHPLHAGRQRATVASAPTRCGSDRRRRPGGRRPARRTA
ncbi:MAG: hypothetical protein ACLRMJ_05665 [Alistipes finegoldii]